MHATMSAMRKRWCGSKERIKKKMEAYMLMVI